MKSLLLTTFIAATIFSQAQIPDYFENYPSWYLETLHHGAGDGSDSFSERGVISLELDADYDGYYTAIYRYWRHYVDLGSTEENSRTLRHVRQEARDIYFYNEETEADELFISYDLEVGDTVKGEFANINGHVIVQSIDSVLVGGYYHHIFYTDPEPNEYENRHLIEGIGYLYNDEESIGDFFAGPQYAGEGIGFDVFLHCYGQQNIPLWSSIEGATCNLTLSIDETNETLEASTSIFPNPFQDILTIETPSQVKQISVYSTSGAMVLEKINTTNQTTIDLSRIDSGSYILLIELEDGRIDRKKIMKQ